MLTLTGLLFAIAFTFQLATVPLRAANPTDDAGKMDWFQHDKLRR
ncbi:MAG: hypothetical protein ACJ746_16160 [Bryobacteraceae bacterium]